MKIEVTQESETINIPVIIVRPCYDIFSDDEALADYLHRHDPSEEAERLFDNE